MDVSPRIVELEAQLEQTKGELKKTQDELKRAQSDLEKIRHAYQRVLEELALMRKRLFAAKSERKDTTAEQLVFDDLVAEAALLANALKAAEEAQKKEQAGKDPKAPESAVPLAGARLPLVHVRREGAAVRLDARGPGCWA